MSERKRKHKALSGENADVERKVITPKTDSNRSSVVVANTGNIPAQGAGNAKATLPSACMKLHESPCETLPPGLIAKIGTYCKLAPLGTDIDKKTLMSLCLAVGPYVASYIRKAYLENRLYYLSYLKRYLRVRQNYENKPLSDNDCADLGEKLKQWMLHNPWWKEACLYPTTFNQKQGGEYPPICKVIRLQESTDAGGVRAWLNASIYSTTSLQVAIDPQLCRFLFDKAWDERYIIAISVNGDQDSASSAEKFRKIMFTPGIEKNVHFMHRLFAFFFFNPVLSINLGQLDLLRFQLEELRLDVNEQNWIGPRIGNVRLPPIFHCMIQPDKSFFEYLISFDGVLLNPNLDRSPITDAAAPSNTTLLHYLNQIVGLVLQGSFDVSRLKILLSQDKVDVDFGPPFPDEALGENVPERISPLYSLFCSAIKFESDFDIVEAFVDAGAGVDYALSAASSSGFHRGLQRGLEMTLWSYHGSPRFAAIADSITLDDMRSIHNRLVAFLRKLKGQNEQNSL